MPIRRYVEEASAFSPESVAVLNAAFAAAADALQVRDESSRKRLAKIIIRLAGQNETLDADALVSEAVRAFAKNIA
jgi:hypothetical protein